MRQNYTLLAQLNNTQSFSSSSFFSTFHPFLCYFNKHKCPLSCVTCPKATTGRIKFLRRKKKSTFPFESRTKRPLELNNKRTTQISSVLFTMVFTCSGKPICAPPRLSEVFFLLFFFPPQRHVAFATGTMFV